MVPETSTVSLFVFVMVKPEAASPATAVPYLELSTPDTSASVTV